MPPRSLTTSSTERPIKGERALAGGLDTEVVAAADGEGETEAAQAGVVGVEDDVSGRVVAVFVHRVRTVETERGGKAHVVDAGAGDGRHREVPIRSGARPDASSSAQSSSGIEVRDRSTLLSTC